MAEQPSHAFPANTVITVQMCPEGLAGIEIKVDGFSHKLPLLVQYIFKQLVGLKIEPSCFERVREGLLRRYKNANMKPDKHATYLRIYTIKEKLWPVEAVQAQLEVLTPSDLQGDLARMLLRFSTTELAFLKPSYRTRLITHLHRLHMQSNGCAVSVHSAWPESEGLLSYVYAARTDLTLWCSLCTVRVQRLALFQLTALHDLSVQMPKYRRLQESHTGTYNSINALSRFVSLDAKLLCIACMSTVN